MVSRAPVAYPDIVSGNDLLFNDAARNEQFVSQSLETLVQDTTNYSVTNLNGHLDNAELQAVRTAATSAAHITKVSAGFGVALSLSPLFGVLDRVGNQLNRLPGPFRHVGTAFRESATRLQAAVHQVSEGIAADQAALLRHHTVVNHWTTYEILRQIALSHGGAYGGSSAQVPSGKPAGAVTGPVTQAQINGVETAVQDVNAKISHINNEIASENRRIDALAYALGVEQHSGAVPIQYRDQIHVLQGQVAQLQTALRDAVKTINDTEARVTTLDEQVAGLAHEIGGVATVTTTWPDIENALKTRVSTLQVHVSTLSNGLNNANSRIAQLAPLTLLLQAGMRGLRTLRQLEDTPCMCPPPPQAKTDLALALALDQALLNGV